MRPIINIIFLISFLTLIIACNEEESDFGCIDSNNNRVDLSSCFSPEFGTIEVEQFYYSFEKGEIENDESLKPTYSIDDGSKLVFIYRHLSDPTNAIDDEFEERVLFQVDSDLKAFVFDSESEFENSKCIYGACGTSYPNVSFKSITGKIEGVNISECEWELEFDIDVQRFNADQVSIQFKEIFQI